MADTNLIVTDECSTTAYIHPWRVDSGKIQNTKPHTLVMVLDLPGKPYQIDGAIWTTNNEMLKFNLDFNSEKEC